MRLPLLCAIGLGLSACASGPPPMKALASADVRCINNYLYNEGNPVKVDYGAAFKAALPICGHARPDLTGDNNLQQIALSDKIPFTIRSEADTYIKDHDTRTDIGSVIRVRKMDPYTGEITAGPTVSSGNR